MRKKIITAVLAVMMSISLVPASVSVMAQTVSVESSNAATAFSSYAKINGDFSSKTYTGSALTPSFTVTASDVPFTAYTPKWTTGTGDSETQVYTLQDAGTYKLTLTPDDTDKYSGTITQNFTINKAAVTITPTTQIYTQTYDGSPKSYPYTFSGGNGSDYVVAITYKKDGTEVARPTYPGTYAVTITATIKDDKKANYTQASYTSTGSLVINKINLNNYTVSLSNAHKNATTGANEITYTGSNVIDAASVQFKDENGHAPSFAFTSDDYTISPTTATSLGNYTLRATAKGTSKYYTGSAKPFGFSIVNATSTTGLEFTSSNVHANDDNNTIKDKTWTGSPVTLTTSGNSAELKVYYTGNDGKKKLLTAGTDYTVSYENNKDVGRATVKVTGAGAYMNKEVDFNFQIDQKPLTTSMITVSPTSYAYTGAAIEPTITVRDGGRTLTKGTDYTVTYPDKDQPSNGYTDAGTNLRVLINGTGTNYNGTIQKYYTITPHALTAAEVELEKTVYTVNGDANTNIPAQTPSATISPKVGRVASFTVSNGSPANGVSISYSNNTKAGTATATIKGSGNYSGTVTKNFTIVVQNLNATALTSSNTVISDIAAVTYNGNQQKPGVTVKYNGVALSSGRDYVLSYGTNIEVGTGSVTVTGTGGYKGSLTKSFTINPANISVASIASIPSQAYTGGAITPALTITHNGSTLREGTDYRAYYSNNKNKGTATVRIQGLRNFTGETTRTFSIVDKKDLEKGIYATAFTLPEEVSVTAGGTVSITASLTPANANKYSIRWSTGSASFPFSDGLTAETKENTPSIEVKGGKEGSAVITATLYGENNKEIGTAYTLVKIEKRFDDVSTSTYYSTAVDALANYGYTTGSGASREFHATPVVNGNTTTTYNPAGPVTRGQFVTMMYNKALADYKAGKSTTDPSKAAASGFSDVGSSAYYASAVNWASANGIAQGTSASTFNPNGTVTRAEAVTFLQRWLGGSSAASTQFSDVASSSYYSGAVGWAVKNGVTNGTSATTFEPGTKCNRGQAATFIYRAAF